jgi:hypothetical protein
MFTVYAVKNADKSVSIYKDYDLTQLFATFDRDHSGKPKKNSKKVMINCFTWSLEWVN